MATTKELLQFGLSDSSTSTGAAVDRVATVMLGLFTSIVFSHVNDANTSQRLEQLTLIALACTLIVFWLIRLFVTSRVANDLHDHSRDYWRLVMKCIEFMRYAHLFLLANFFGSFFSRLWTASAATMTTFEMFEAILSLFLLFSFMLLLIHKPRSQTAAAAAAAASTTHKNQLAQE